jgi:hypothetical protein
MVILILVPVGSIIRVIRSKRMSWTGHVALAGGGGGGMHAGFEGGNLVERDHLEDLGVDGRIRIEFFSNRLEVGEGIDWIDLVQDMGK